MVKKYNLRYTRSTSLLTASVKGKVNYFYIFGGRDESSYTLIQGITLFGCLFDEVALMPRSFVDQAITRSLSVDDSKLWFNCNPESPKHWFYTDWILDAERHNAKHLHFLLEDNPSLTDRAIEKAKRSFVGVFYDRYIRGLWVTAEGSIYRIFSEREDEYKVEDPRDLIEVNIGVDFGGSGSAHSFVATGITRGYHSLVALISERHENKDHIIDPDELGKLFVAFVNRVVALHGVPRAAYCDSAEQTLIAGLRASCRTGGCGWLKIENALKTTINDRIKFTLRLMAQNRFGYVPHNCESLAGALSTAVWDSKDPTSDRRLDNGTSDIDTLDAFEYSFERQMSRFMRME